MATESHSSAMADWFRRTLAPYLPSPEGKSLLDIGCGMGFALRAMDEYGFARVQGIDISPGQIELCKELGHPGELVDNTVSYLSSHPSEYDVILMLDVLEHVRRDEQIGLMRAVRDSLRPGGSVLIKVPNAASSIAARWLYQDFTHECAFTQYSLEFVLLNAGFSNVVCKDPYPVRMPRAFWRKGFFCSLRRWAVRSLWRQILISELGATALSEPLDVNLLCVANR